MTTPQRVETDLGWALFAVLRGYRQRADALLADLPGGPRGYHVLGAAAAGEPSTQLALAQRLGLDRTVMTYLIDDLEKGGLVERRPDPADRRVRRIAITDAGRARLCAFERALRDVEAALLEPLEPAERDAFRALLYRLATRTDAGGESNCQEAKATQESPVLAARRPVRRR